MAKRKRIAIERTFKKGQYLSDAEVKGLFTTPADVDKVEVLSNGTFDDGSNFTTIKIYFKKS